MNARAALRRGAPVAFESVLALAAGVASFVITAALGTAARSRVPEALCAVLLLAAVVVVSRLARILFALPVGVAAVLAFDWYYLPPLRALDANTVLVLGSFLIMAVVVGAVASLAGRRARTSEQAVGALAAEQGALRRVATLVARQGTPAEVFQAVAEEAGHLLQVDLAQLFSYETEQTAVLAGTWSREGHLPNPIGGVLRLTADGIVARVFRTGRPVRIPDYADLEGPASDWVRLMGIRTGVGAPVVVEGRTWGVMTAASRRPEPLAAGAETRLSAFTELVATAIANAQARLVLRASAEEQAALRRVATLVARATPPETVYAAVAEEIGRLLNVEFTILSRCEPDGAQVSVGTWGGTGAAMPFPVGTRVRLGGRNVVSLVVESGRPVRIDDYAEATGPVAVTARTGGFRAAVGVPISVEGRLWGVISVATGQPSPLPPETEARLAGFTELVATSIANAQARVELRRHAEEQAALRRVATLVARAVPPEEVFAAVAAEVGQLLLVEYTVMSRYDPDGAITVVGEWSQTGAPMPVPVGTRVEAGGHNVYTRVFDTRRTTRVDEQTDAPGPTDDARRLMGIRSSVGAPIVVSGHVWGVITVCSTRAEPLPTETEGRLAAFTELVSTGLANVEARTALSASRARIVAAADSTRRRMERDLHDGVQQGLVSLILQAAAVGELSDDQAQQMRAELVGLRKGLVTALDELREISRGIHPAILTEVGLGAALGSLARRCPVPVRVETSVEGRLPEPVEVAAYYVVSEALTNAVKHAEASQIEVALALDDGMLRVRVRDDGRGGADLGGGTGLVGLTDRVEALGGRFALSSPPGVGTTVQIWLPAADALLQAVPVPLTAPTG